MSDPEDFKLGGRHNSGDPEGKRAAEITNSSPVQPTEPALALLQAVYTDHTIALPERLARAIKKVIENAAHPPVQPTEPQDYHGELFPMGDSHPLDVPDPPVQPTEPK